jgi:hypothetical protein
MARTPLARALSDAHLVIDELCAGIRELDPGSCTAVMTRLATRMRAVAAARERAQRLRGLAHR